MMLLPLRQPPPLSEGKVAYLGEVGSEEFIMKLTSQITEMVSAKISQGTCVDCHTLNAVRLCRAIVQHSIHKSNTEQCNSSYVCPGDDFIGILKCVVVTRLV